MLQRNRQSSQEEAFSRTSDRMALFQQQPYLAFGSRNHPTGSAIRGLRTDVSSRFGQRLRQLRRERNMTQARVAKDFGIDRSYLSEVERGKKSMSLPMLEVIALGMNLSLSDLVRGL